MPRTRKAPHKFTLHLAWSGALSRWAALLCLSASLHPLQAETLALPESKLQLGVTQILAAGTDPGVHYKLYLPQEYGTKTDKLFPVVINQNPSGRTNLQPYEAWAEQQGVILLGIDGISNGKAQQLKNQIADAVLADFAQRCPRAHPTLRVVIGMSGGSADGMRLVRRKPESYAGCVYMGSGAILDSPKAGHLAYAILGGAKDEWMAGNACDTLAAKARDLGCPVRLEVEIDRQHKEAPVDRQTAALTWIFEYQKLRLPSLGGAERETNMNAGRVRMQAVGKIADDATRRAEAEFLLTLKPLESFPAERSEVLADWGTTMQKLAEAEPSPVLRNVFLNVEVLRMPWAADLPSNLKTALAQMVTELHKDPAVARDWVIRERYLSNEELEKSAGLNPDKLREALTVWQALSKDVEGSEWEAKVARRVRIVTLFIDSPSTIQQPTKLRD
jgi:pimeloyl-ACP methyl ester carboxylesterase